MTVLEKIKEKLAVAGVEYELIEHEPVYTSADAARVRGEELSDGAKALVLFGDKTPILCVVPGDKRADFKKIKTHLEIKDLRMATPEEVKELTTLEIGAIPPVGSAMNLPSYYDNSFILKENVAFNAGDHSVTIIMTGDDLIRVEKPKILDIAK
jgi:prolyl-tRNA editing enzyme YbaK/EbsC (Cys-tRNA(Pro) deacylase)